MRSIRYETGGDCMRNSRTAIASVLPTHEIGKIDVLARVEDVVCPICRRHIFSCNDAVVRLKTRILVFENGTAYAKCKYCRNDVVVPLVMHEMLDEEWLPVWNEALDGQTG